LGRANIDNGVHNRDMMATSLPADHRGSPSPTPIPLGGSSLRPPLPLPLTPLIGRERELMSAHVITVPRRFTGRISC